MWSPLPDPIDTAVVRRSPVTTLRNDDHLLLASPGFTVLKRPRPAAELDRLVCCETVAMHAGHPAIAPRRRLAGGWRRQGLLAQARGGRLGPADRFAWGAQ